MELLNLEEETIFFFFKKKNVMKGEKVEQNPNNEVQKVKIYSLTLHLHRELY